MPLPAEVAYLKVHPAIGIARVSSSPDYFVFGDPITTYKTDGLLRRQAVRFRAFAYDAAGRALDELTPARLASLGLTAVWTAHLANRKLAHLTRCSSDCFSSEGRSDRDGGAIVGSLTSFPLAREVPLGEIHDDGLFVPPVAAVYQRNDRPYVPTHALRTADIIDNTSDGPISLELQELENGAPVAITVRPAWVVVAPPDFCPDADDSQIPWADRLNLAQYLAERLGLPSPSHPASPLNRTAQQLNQAALLPCTGTQCSGIEVSLSIYPGLTTMMDPAASAAGEARFLPRSHAGAGGAVPGDLTCGLCSPWQFDFLHCPCHSWAAQRPDVLFANDEGTEEVSWLRKRVADSRSRRGEGVVSDDNEFIRSIDRLGVARGPADRLVETERTEDLP